MIFLLAAIFLMGAANNDAQDFSKGYRNYFVSPEFLDLVQYKDKFYAATGYGLSILDPNIFASKKTSGSKNLIKSLATPGYASTVLVANKNVYVAGGNLVSEFKLSSKGAGLVKNYSLPKAQKGLAFLADDKNIYIATDSSRLLILKQSQRLVPVAELKLPGLPSSMVLYKEYLYVACGKNSIAVVKLTKVPELITSVNASGVNVLTAGGDKLFAATFSSEIVVFNIKNPQQPKRGKTFASLAPAVKLEYFDNYLYAALGYQGYAVFNRAGKRIEDVEPYKGGYVADILPVKNALYLAVGQKGIVKLAGDAVNKLKKIKTVSNHTPILHTSRGGAFWGIARDRKGVNVVKLTPDTLDIGFVNPRPVKAAGVLMSGPNVYVADAERDVSIYTLKTFPAAERKFDLFQPGKPRRITLQNDLIYVAAGEKGVRVLWICPCGPLKQKGAFEDAFALDAAVKDSLLYIADPNEGLKLVSVKEEGKTLKLLNIYPGAISPQALLKKDDILYVADSIGAIAVLDISQAEKPKQLAFLKIGARPYGLGMHDSTLFIACGERGILPVDVSSPENPIPHDFIETPGKALAVAASDKYIGVADFTSWVVISRPVTP